MANSQRIESACKQFAGKVLTSLQVKAVTEKAFPGTTCYPGDAAWDDTRYGDKVLQKTGSGYLVLPADQIKRRAQGSRGRSNGVTLDQAYASAMALLQTVPANKANGAATKAAN